MATTNRESETTPYLAYHRVGAAPAGGRRQIDELESSITPLVDVVRPSDSIPDLEFARAAVADHPGPFGAGATAYDLMHVLEWFVAPPFEMMLEPDGGGRVDLACACFCGNEAFQFHGLILDNNVQTAEFKWDVWLQPGNERAHLERIRKFSGPSLKPHLRRTYESLSSLGFQRIGLEAGLRDGPTYWAHAGVDFAAGRALLDHLEGVAADLAGAPLPDLRFESPKDVLTALPGVEATIYDAYCSSARISTLPGQELWVRPPTQLLHKVVNLGVPVDVRRPIGEAILHAIAPWNGVVDMSDPGASDAAFQAFLAL